MLSEAAAAAEEEEEEREIEKDSAGDSTRTKASPRRKMPSPFADERKTPPHSSSIRFACAWAPPN